MYLIGKNKTPYITASTAATQFNVSRQRVYILGHSQVRSLWHKDNDGKMVKLFHLNDLQEYFKKPIDS
jgi:hypothetical protein